MPKFSVLNVGPRTRRDGNLDICMVCDLPITLKEVPDDDGELVLSWVHQDNNDINKRNESIRKHVDVIDQEEQANNNG